MSSLSQITVHTPRRSGHSRSPLGILPTVVTHRRLILALTRRDLAERFRGTLLGTLWFVLGPAVLMGVYTLTFSVVFRARMPYADPASDGHGLFGVFLFAGLVPFTVFSDVVARSPSLITSRANYVTRVVFPIEVLSLVAVLSALCGGLLSSAVLVVALAVLGGGVPVTALAYPLCLGLMVPLLIGLSWTLAAIGTYVRDLGQVTPLVLSVCLFVSPIFTTIDRFPPGIQPWLYLNPVTVPVDLAQKLLFVLTWPGFLVVGAYAAAGLAVMAAGWMCFQTLRRGFADVL